jgi:hypothetical protein
MIAPYMKFEICLDEKVGAQISIFEGDFCFCEPSHFSRMSTRLVKVDLSDI